MVFNRCIFNHLTVGCWNIEGADENINSVKISKLDQSPFLDTLKFFDILCIQESHLSEEDNIPKVDGYETTPHSRKRSGNNRFFGGMVVYVKTSIKNGLKIDRNFDVDTLEIILSKSFFGLENDVKILFTYASPATSNYTRTRDMNVLEKIEAIYIGGDKNVIIMGDLNGKTKQGEDFIADSRDKYSPINSLPYVKDQHSKRENKDQHAIDEQGKLILDLCKTSGLRILNGRITGDLQGQFTRYPTRCGNDRPSTIDYALCSDELRKEVTKFTVLPFSGISDHCCISLNIKTNSKTQDFIPAQTASNQNTSHSKTRYVYDKQNRHIFEQALKAEKTKLDELVLTLDANQDTEAVNNGISEINDILLRAAKKSNFARKSKQQAKRKPQKSQDWYTKECKAHKTMMRKYAKDLSTNLFDRDKHQRFLNARRVYKRTCRNSEKLYRSNLKKKLIDVGMNNPKLFWKIVTEMNNWGKKSTDPADKIPAQDWENHYKKLLNDSGPNVDIATPAMKTFDPTLDGIVTKIELQNALKLIKPLKAAGPDRILGEYLKVFGQMYEPILLKLIQTIFANHVYPDSWRINFLKSIYKKGPDKDTNNYRGLAIGSTFGKLFSNILLNRLMKHITGKGLISPNQIGFMKGHGTSDHIFLLQTIVEKVVKKQNKKLYAVFIDFKKAYDTVDRHILIKRLADLGINGIFLQNIAVMYNKIEYIVKLGTGNSNGISSNLGLKQGCPLSPMLFNLYIDDIGEIFDETCNPVEIQNTYLNHFLYADDLVLLSHTKEGLQNCLDRVHKWADSKRLTISIAKSKSMIFNLSGRLEKQIFKINGEPLENVNTFCYLGFEVKSSGTVNHAMNVLNDKGKRALRPLMTAIARFKIPIPTSIKLFHTYITPILLYNVENWFKLSDMKLTNFDRNTVFDETSTSNKLDTAHRKFLRYILGLSKSSSNLPIYGETGEIPLLIKGIRHMLNYWHRLTKLPESTLAKKALLEHATLRTSWLITIEKLINRFNLADKIGNHNVFKWSTKNILNSEYQEFWKNSVRTNGGKLEFYHRVKGTFGMEQYLCIDNFEQRKIIAKLRCSNHCLEIEAARHRRPKPDRELRICKSCDAGLVESEEHFLLHCTKYDELRARFELVHKSLLEIMNQDEQSKLGSFLLEAFTTRSQV